MEISASEINLLCKRITPLTDGYSVSSVYSIRGGLLLRMRHETKEEKLIAVASFAPWITTKNLSLDQAEPFVTRTREKIERCRLIMVRQEGTERICTFAFSSRTGQTSYLHAEFFGRGNLVLTDVDEKIIDIENPQRFRHRSLVPGERYVFPPSRGKSLEEIDEHYLVSELVRAKLDGRGANIEAIRWFGRIAGTSRKFVEEIFFMSEISHDLPVNQLDTPDIQKLASSSKKLSRAIESSNKGYLLLPRDQEEDIEVDACPIVPHGWALLSERGSASIREFDSYDKALDDAQVQSLMFEKKQKASKEIRSKAAELESAIRKQDETMESNRERSSELRNLGTQLMTDASLEVAQDLLSKLETMKVLEKDEVHHDQLRFRNEPKSYLKTYATPRSLASRLFDEAKKLEQNNEEISKIREELLKRQQNLLEQSKAFEDRAGKRIAIERRPKQWFERYRWFLTSDLRLAVGGKDMTSNSIIINKYMDQNSLVFHADLHGSPFFLLKNGKEEDKLNLVPQIEQELAQATASFSRAWKDELGSADAYWVEPKQVKKSAPSGEYLPRGSFFIEGKKNFVKHLRVELCVGLMTFDVLSRAKLVDTEETNKNTLLVVCGPEKSLSEYCVSNVKISPGKERGSIVARRVKQLLVTKVKENQTEVKDLAKRIPIDEIIRAFPSGSFKIMSDKHNG
jgi:predicted ribosome quality control (RQC) complex YloA/Tae2 family protein